MPKQLGANTLIPVALFRVYIRQIAPFVGEPMRVGDIMDDVHAYMSDNFTLILPEQPKTSNWMPQLHWCKNLHKLE